MLLASAEPACPRQSVDSLRIIGFICCAMVTRPSRRPHSPLVAQLAQDFTDARDLTERLHALYKATTHEINDMPFTTLLSALVQGCNPSPLAL